MRLTKRELAVLGVLLMAAPDAVYGMDIARQVYPRWMRWLMPAGIYVHLMRLEDRGLIDHVVELVLDDTGRLPRYTYRITDRGRRAWISYQPAGTKLANQTPLMHPT